MATALLQALTALFSRAARKLSRRRSSVLSPGSDRRKKKDSKERFGEEDTDGETEAVDATGGFEDGVWRRTILMGEKCQPLDFSGAIYYDGEGRRLAEVPTPRSPLRSPLPSFAV